MNRTIICLGLLLSADLFAGSSLKYIVSTDHLAQDNTVYDIPVINNSDYSMDVEITVAPIGTYACSEVKTVTIPSKSVYYEQICSVDKVSVKDSFDQIIFRGSFGEASYLCNVRVDHEAILDFRSDKFLSCTISNLARATS